MSLGGDAGSYEIRNNTFSRSTFPALTPSNGTYGIYLNAAKDFNVVDNVMSKMTYGVFVRKSSFTTSFDCNVYSNDFTDIYRPLVTQEDNYKLNVKCNTFNNPNSIAQMYWLNYYFLPAAQGSCASASSPAGNIFNDPIPPSKDIYNYYGATHAFTYYHHNVVAGGYTLSQITPVIGSPGGVTVTSCASTFNPPVTCNYVLPMMPYSGSKMNNMLALGQTPDATRELETGNYAADENAYYRIIIAVMESGRGMYQLNPREQAIMRTIAAGNSAVAENAQATMAGFYNEPYALGGEEVIDNGTEAPATVNELAAAIPVLSDAVPNPAKGTTAVRTFLPDNTGTLELRSITGQLMKSINVPAGVNYNEIDISSFAQGVYLIMLKVDGATVEARRLVVQ